MQSRQLTAAGLYSPTVTMALIPTVEARPAPGRPLANGPRPRQRTHAADLGRDWALAGDRPSESPVRSRWYDASGQVICLSEPPPAGHGSRRAAAVTVDITGHRQPGSDDPGSYCSESLAS